MLNRLRFFAEYLLPPNDPRSHRSTPVEPNTPTSCQFLRRRRTMKNNLPKDPPADISEEDIKRNLNKMPSDEEVKRALEKFDVYDDEKVRALMAKYHIQNPGPNLAPDALTFERISIMFPLVSMAIAPFRRCNPTGLNLTGGRKAIAMEAFASVIPPGEKYDLIRRAHYQAILKLFRVEGRYNFKNKSLTEQRSFVERYVDVCAVNEFIELQTKFDQMQKLAIMKGDEIHPEIVSVAAEWSDD